MLEITFRNFTAAEYESKFFKKILTVTLKTSFPKKPVNWGISVSLVGKSRMRFLNKKFRCKDQSTDVLSFPLEEGIYAKKPSNVMIELGDIFICPNVARQTASRNQTTEEFEMAFLVIHGLLHLLGHDHVESIQAKKMFNLQDKILKKL